MKRLSLLFATFILFLITVLVIPINKVKAFEKPEYWSYISIEYKEIKYRLTDLPNYKDYNVKDNEILNKERILQIPYFVMNLASKKFSKSLQIKKIDIEYEKRDYTSEDKIINKVANNVRKCLSLDAEEVIKPFSIDYDNKTTILEKVDKNKLDTAKLFYDSKQFNLNTLNSKYKIPQTEKVSVLSYDKDVFMLNQRKAWDKENLRLIKSTGKGLDIKTRISESDSHFDIFAHTNHYFKFYLGSLGELTTKGVHISNLKITNIEFDNLEKNEKHDLSNLFTIGSAHYLKDELAEEITAINKKYLDSIGNKDNQETQTEKPSQNKNNTKTIIIIASAFGGVLLLITITTISLIIIKKKKSNQIN